MPYITKENRDKYKNIVESICANPALVAGDLNYLFTQLVKAYLGDTPNYQKYNDAIGALEGCKLEVYRRKTSKYEDEKIEENGDVYGEDVKDKAKTGFMENLCDEAKYLVKQGIYSLYRLTDDRIILYVPAPTSGSLIIGHYANHTKPIIYLLDETGAVLNILPDNSLSGYDTKEHISIQ